MSLGSRKSRGVVLPAMILLSAVLILLIAALLSSGTSSLRATTLSAQSDVAAYAAEAGLVEAVEQYRRDGRLPSTLEGKMDGNEAAYLVEVHENVSDRPEQVPEGPTIPPSTLYLRATGTSPNGTVQRAGALFRTGLGAFEAGVVSDQLSAQNSTFDAYDSKVNPDPAASSVNNRAILASKQNDPAAAAPQFSLQDSNVKGGVYVAPGSVPAQQIRKSGSTLVAREGTLGSPLTIESIELPKLTRGGTAEGGTTSDEFDPGKFATRNQSMGAGSDLQIYWDSTRQEFVFVDEGGFLSSTTVGRASRDELLAAMEGSPPVWRAEQGGGDRIVTINFASGKMEYQDKITGGLGGATKKKANIPSIITDPLSPPDVRTKNPGKIKKGKFKEVVVDDSSSTILDEGTYIIENLIVSDGGKLQLPEGKKATIYVTNRLAAEGENAVINDSRLPTNLKIYYLGSEPVRLNGGSQSYMTLVAPRADLTLEGLNPDTPSAFYGALVGRSVSVVNAALHFDVATEGVGTGTDGSPLSLLARHRL